MKIGLVGSGGREHALAEALVKESAGAELFAYADSPNPGIERRAVQVAFGAMSDVPAIVDYFEGVRPDVVVVGPEIPLVHGAVDALRAAGIPAVGPTKAQARLEGDKSFMRGLLAKSAAWGSPKWLRAESVEEARGFIEKTGDVAVKPLGLTGGKGVRVMGAHLEGAGEAAAYAGRLIAQDGAVLLEERLTGEEFSRMVFASGGKIAPMPVAQDFKYAQDGDTGGMTGGMGAYTDADGSLPFLAESDVAGADRVLEAAISALEKETGEQYRGVLYGQFMAAADGVRVVEFNVRMGDPEGINVMELLESSAVELFLSVAAGTLQPDGVYFSPLASVCKYLVPHAYPETGGPVDFSLDETAIREAGSFGLVFGSVRKTGHGRHGWQALGSRTLALVRLCKTPGRASRRIETLLEEVEPPELRHRRDIGDEDVISAKVERIARLRSGGK